MRQVDCAGETVRLENLPVIGELVVSEVSVRLNGKFETFQHGTVNGGCKKPQLR